MARPVKYNPDFHGRWAKSLARQGLTVKEIAREMGVAKSTVYKWMQDYPELSDSLNEGRAYADGIVEDTLYRLAVGTVKTKEVHTDFKVDSSGAQDSKSVHITEKEVPPSATACIFWLKNRKPKEWRDRQVDEVSITAAPGKVVILPEQVDDEEDE